MLSPVQAEEGPASAPRSAVYSSCFGSGTTVHEAGVRADPAVEGPATVFILPLQCHLFRSQAVLKKLVAFYPTTGEWWICRAYCEGYDVDMYYGDHVWALIFSLGRASRQAKWTCLKGQLPQGADDDDPCPRDAPFTYRSLASGGWCGCSLYSDCVGNHLCYGLHVWAMHHLCEDFHWEHDGDLKGDIHFMQHGFSLSRASCQAIWTCFKGQLPNGADNDDPAPRDAPLEYSSSASGCWFGCRADLRDFLRDGYHGWESSAEGGGACYCSAIGGGMRHEGVATCG